MKKCQHKYKTGLICELPSAEEWCKKHAYHDKPSKYEKKHEYLPCGEPGCDKLTRSKYFMCSAHSSKVRSKRPAPLELETEKIEDEALVTIE